MRSPSACIGIASPSMAWIVTSVASMRGAWANPDRPARGLEDEAGRGAGIDAQGETAGIGPSARVDLQPAPVERRRADDEQLDRPAMHDPAVGANLDRRPEPQVRDRAGDRRRPAGQALRAGLGVPSGDERIPSGAGEKRQASVDLDEVDRPVVSACQDLDLALGVLRQAQQVARTRCRIRPECIRGGGWGGRPPCCRRSPATRRLRRSPRSHSGQVARQATPSAQQRRESR